MPWAPPPDPPRPAILRPSDGGLWALADRQMQQLGLPLPVRRAVARELARVLGSTPGIIRATLDDLARFAGNSALASLPGLPAAIRKPAAGGAEVASVSYVDGYSSTANASAYTFAGAALGDTGLPLVLGPVGDTNQSSRSLSTVSVAGVSATRRVDAGTISDNSLSEIWTVELGGSDATTGDIVTTYNNTMLRAFVFLWRISAQSLVPTDTDFSVSNSNAGSLNIEAGGVAVAVCANDTTTLTGVTGLTFRESVTASVVAGSADGAFVTPQTGLSIDFSPNGSGHQTFAGAAFR